MIEQHSVEAVPITAGPDHYFGYYDKYPWNRSGRLHLGMRIGFNDRQPGTDDVAVLGTIDTENGNAWTPFAETRAWSWQQGTMLQWLPSEPEDTVIYNIRDGASFRAEIRNLRTGESRRLPRPVYTVSETHALSLNFARLHLTRPGYGYPDGTGGRINEFHPADEGVWRIDLRTGEDELIVSLDQLAAVEPVAAMEKGPMWVNHLNWSPDGTNFVFLNRFFRDHARRPFFDRFYFSNADGSGLRKVHDRDYFSHFTYFSEHDLLGYARASNGRDAYIMFDLDTGDEQLVGSGVFDSDGHCNASPDRRWMLTDTYPNSADERTLILFDMASGRRIDIGQFHSPPELAGPLRCDLHPRWSRDGKRISIDSAHTGTRQIYALNVSEVTGRA